MNKIIRSYNFVFDYTKFRNDIRAFCDAYELTHLELDQLSGVGNGNVSNIMAGVENNKMQTWISIANAMDIDVRTYFVLEIPE